MREREGGGRGEREREREGGEGETYLVGIHNIMCTCDSLRVFLFCIVLETIEAICFQRAFEAVSHSVCVSSMCSITKYCNSIIIHAYM